MVSSFLKNNPNCLIICPSFYHPYFSEMKKKDESLSFAYMSLEEIEDLVKNSPDAKDHVENRSIYILHYDCGPKISSILGEFHNMSISYFPKGLAKQIDQDLGK